MAKRFTDTNLIKQPWYRKLPPKIKCFWHFLCAECDHAGFWNIDMDYASLMIGESLSLQEIILELTRDKENRIEVRNNAKLYIPGFIEFQYKCHAFELNPKNIVHLSVINILKKEGAWQGLPRGLAGAKDKDKEKDTVIDKVKELDKDKDTDKEENIAEIRRSISKSLQI